MDIHTLFVKEFKETNHWELEECKVCNARIRTVNETEHGNVSNHSHLPDGAQINILKALDF